MFIVIYFAFVSTGAAQQPSSPLLTHLVSQNSVDDQIEYANFKDWFVQCTVSAKSDVKRCELTTNQVAPENNQAIAPISLKVVFEGKNKPGIVLLQTPLDLLLSKGVDLEIDRKKIGKLSYRSCHTDGCLIPFSASGSVNRAMLRGLSAKFTVFNLEGKAFNSTFSLAGISSATKFADGF